MTFAITLLLIAFLFLEPLSKLVSAVFHSVVQHPKFASLFFLIFSIYAYGNLTGLSWGKLQYTSEEKIIEQAVKASYGYDLAELRRQHPDFTPRAEYWGEWIYEEADSHLVNKLLGYKRYQVRLPDAVVVLNTDGEVLYSRACGDNSPYCTKISPKKQKARPDPQALLLSSGDF